MGLQRLAGNAAVSSMLQRLVGPEEDVQTSPVLEVVGRGGGQPLASEVRTDMESRLGSDFSNVRVHTDSKAAASAAAVSAQAYTVGNEIVFGSGSYAPESTSGMHTIAHELTHVQQQNRGPVAGTDAGTGVAISDPTDAFEREAEEIASRAIPTRRVERIDPTAGGDRQSPVQRSGGDPRVSRLVSSTAVQRWVGSEHEAIGNATGATIDLGGGIVLTWGEVVAIAGDEYGSVEELRAAVTTSDGQANLRARLHHDGVVGPIPAGLPPEPAHPSTTEYVLLAMNNLAHFAGGGTALQTWGSHHEAALVSSIISGIDGDENSWQSAQLTEAFGQHFLTDAFSAGHIRTPRAEIMSWYEGVFAPRALGPFVDNFRIWVTDQVTRDIGSQTPVPDVAIHEALDQVLSPVLAFAEGAFRAEGQHWFGLAISGAISGALHDRDNAAGIWVNSEAHPEAWQAFGDNRLICSPISADQASIAVITAREQLVQAQSLGINRRAMKGVTPSPAGQAGPPDGVPGVVHFGFDSSDLDVAAFGALNSASNFMAAHPEVSVDIVGHTDPLGTDGYNDGLGMRRAEVTVNFLQSHGIAPGRTTMTSAGEHQLVSQDRAGFPQDRRAELHFRQTGDEEPDLVWAQQIIGQTLPGPPYPAVERYVPHEVPGANQPQEDWHWGTLTSEMAEEVDTWIKAYVGNAVPSIMAMDWVKDYPIPVPAATGGNIVMHLPAAMKGFFDKLLAAPLAFVGGLVGETAANRSVEPPPAPVACPPVKP